MDLGSSCVSLQPAPLLQAAPGTAADCPALMETLPPSFSNPPSCKATADQPTQLGLPKTVLLSFSKPELPAFNPSGPQGRLSPLEKVLEEAKRAALGKICPLKAALQWLESIFTQPRPG